MFVIDSNVFIEAHRLYYAFDLVPGFWSRLQADDMMVSVDRVLVELARGGDDLAAWAARWPQLFKPTDREDVIAEFRSLMEWVQQQPRFMPAAKSEFADVADGWVIAFAKVHGAAVVTREQRRPQSRRKVAMPDVCEHFGVEVVDTFNMLRRQGVRFT